MTDQLPSKDLCSQLRALPAGYRLLGYTAAEEIERLRTCLTGISTCGTCSVCSGAARLALGGAQVVSNAPVYPYQQNPIASASISTSQPPGDGQ